MKIFCISIYNESYDFFKKSRLIPVGVGNRKFDKEWLNDKTEINVASKNSNFGEYTFHYALWKSGLLKKDDKNWTGFCSYRRFWVNKNFIEPKNLNDLNNAILTEVPEEWNQYDSVLAEPIILGKQKLMKLLKNNFTYIFKKPTLLFRKMSVRDHFNLNHGSYFLEEAIKLLDLEEQDAFKIFLDKNEFNPHNIFICKNHILIEAFYKKIFDWLFKCEEKFKKLDLDTYGKKRIYGFLAERFMPFWFKRNSKSLNWPYIFFDTNKYK